ncbi:ATP-binding protein [Streptomyces sp. NPDC004539]|uniref:ATP-binding protein n=1 Tax=Streptomyces sp. NPDC004539 TaxID=3154280 RepID=UPI0033B3FFB3
MTSTAHEGIADRDVSPGPGPARGARQTDAPDAPALHTQGRTRRPRRSPADAATRRLRRHSANFPTGKTLASWRAEDSTIPESTQNSLITLEWIGRAENLVIAGPSGTGKSHFTEGLAQAATEKDLRVAWFTLETLATVIGKSKVDAAYERRSIAVTSNIHPSGFDTIMPKTLAGASTDRLMHHAHLLTTTGDSHRLSEALAGKGVVPLT